MLVSYAPNILIEQYRTVLHYSISTGSIYHRVVQGTNYSITLNNPSNKTDLSTSLMESACSMAAAVLATSNGLMRIAPFSRLEHAENSDASTTPAVSGSLLVKMYSKGMRFSPWKARSQMMQHGIIDNTTK